MDQTEQARLVAALKALDEEARRQVVEAAMSVDELEELAESYFNVDRRDGPRIYRATWGEGYQPRTGDYYAAGFTVERGYTPADVDAILALAVGETWTAPANEVHTVTRIE